MTFTQTQLDAIDTAIARGELIVRIDDKEIKFQSADDLLKRRTFIAAQIRAQTVTTGNQPRYKTADFSDD